MRARTGFTRRGALTTLGGLAAAACGERPEAPAYAGNVVFAHGVASGDPADTGVVIWTRVTPEQAGPVPVRWVVARDRALTSVVRTGVFVTNAIRDYTVKVDVPDLRPGAPYFYGFLAGDQVSPVGRTRTLPRGRLSKLTLAVVSCASFPHGFFNVYEALARRTELDLVVHLGDYIYEYGMSGYGGDSAVRLGRLPRPEIECVKLEDYRQRHAQAKSEAELQAAHARCPWIVAWDDHEIANDCWSGGAENHNPGEGPWDERRRAALQAYYEWMPIRDPVEGAAPSAINRAFHFGDLASLCMLETRLLSRDKPFDYASQMPLRMQLWDFTNANAPTPLPAFAGNSPHARPVPAVFRKVGREYAPVFDWAVVQSALANPRHPPEGLCFKPDAAKLRELLEDPARRLLGPAQEEWLARELADSVVNGARWQVLGSQVLMAPVTAPDLSDTPAELAVQLERLRPGVTQLLGFTTEQFPLNTDAWDGYPHARARVLAMVREARANALVLSGDSHAAWVNEIADEAGLAAVEFGAPSVTSPSDAEYFYAAGVDFAARLKERNANVNWTEQRKHGYLLLTLTPEDAVGEFFMVSDVASKRFEVERAAGYRVTPGDAAIAGLAPAAPLEE